MEKRPRIPRTENEDEKASSGKGSEDKVSSAVWMVSSRAQGETHDTGTAGVTLLLCAGVAMETHIPVSVALKCVEHVTAVRTQQMGQVQKHKVEMMTINLSTRRE
ncbi:hypothetical protein C0Q70_08587 [Pomacea canaliculata]|uniref:Uncharacterized protein n=1 Tax=Pomacea canaliculata TaxID=400727 RepID=A0A2T7PI89_POMCA|nr:hypothetical protein C0Q70_08587 [Pomacea canaliculata]